MTDAEKLAQVREYRRVYYQKNKERLLSYTRRWQAEHPERTSENKKKWRLLNAARDARATQDSARRRRVFIRSVKDVPCMDCGVKYPHYVMQFDHLRDKSFGVSRGYSRSQEALLAEIAKCEIVCANCHAARGYQRLQLSPRAEESPSEVSPRPWMRKR